MLCRVCVCMLSMCECVRVCECLYECIMLCASEKERLVMRRRERCRNETVVPGAAFQTQQAWGNISYALRNSLPLGAQHSKHLGRVSYQCDNFIVVTC